MIDLSHNLTVEFYIIEEWEVAQDGKIWDTRKTLKILLFNENQEELDSYTICETAQIWDPILDVTKGGGYFLVCYGLPLGGDACQRCIIFSITTNNKIEIVENLERYPNHYRKILGTPNICWIYEDDRQSLRSLRLIWNCNKEKIEFIEIQDKPKKFVGEWVTRNKIIKKEIETTRTECSTGIDVSNYSINKSLEFPVVVHIPHASTRVPKDFYDGFIISESEIKKEALRVADLFSDSFFFGLMERFGGIRSLLSKIVIDPEGFHSGIRKPLGAVGTDVLHTKTESGELMRDLDNKKRDELLEHHFFPYQEQLRSIIAEKHEKFGNCLLLGLHSFSSGPKNPYDPDQTWPRPDVVIGSNGFHTPRSLAVGLMTELKIAGFSSEEKIIFADNLIPSPYSYKNKAIMYVGVSINKKLYMDEDLLKKRSCFERVAEEIQQVICNAVAAHFMIGNVRKGNLSHGN